MFSYFGCLYRDHTQPAEKATSSFLASVPQLPVNPTIPQPVAVPEDPLARTIPAKTDVSKLTPTELAADVLELFNTETGAKHKVEGGASQLSAKFYYQKKQFVWEYIDISNLDPSNMNKKKKVEVKFQDIKRISIRAIEGYPGQLTLETGKPLVMYREKGPQPGKNTQWMKSDDFTGGVGTPRDSGAVTLTTVFAKDALTKKQAGQTPLDKLLSSDPELQKLIDTDQDTNYEPSREQPEAPEEPFSKYLNGSVASPTFNEPAHPNYVLYDTTSGAYLQETVSEGYTDELLDKSTEELIAQMSKVLKPKRLTIPTLKKLKFKCPACKCSKKFNTDRELHDHMLHKHKHLLDLGIDVISSGEFRVSKKFLINILMFAKAHPEMVKTATKAINYVDPA